MNQPPQMETLTEAITRFQMLGYSGSWSARAGGVLRCTTCGADIDAVEVVIDEFVRFEGQSDPGDEAILYALTGPCGDRGLYSSSYGPYAGELDTEVASRFRR